jgi:hypothetical protein
MTDLEKAARMALEAGIPAAKYPSLISDSDWEALERFFQAAYAAGAAAEREACAQVCENPDLLVNSTFQGVAEAIRARLKEKNIK